MRTCYLIHDPEQLWNNTLTPLTLTERHPLQHYLSLTIRTTPPSHSTTFSDMSPLQKLPPMMVRILLYFGLLKQSITKFTFSHRPPDFWDSTSLVFGTYHISLVGSIIIGRCLMYKLFFCYWCIFIQLLFFFLVGRLFNFIYALLHDILGKFC